MKSVLLTYNKNRRVGEAPSLERPRPLLVSSLAPGTSFETLTHHGGAGSEQNLRPTRTPPRILRISVPLSNPAPAATRPAIAAAGGSATPSKRNQNVESGGTLCRCDPASVAGGQAALEVPQALSRACDLERFPPARCPGAQPRIVSIRPTFPVLFPVLAPERTFGGPPTMFLPMNSRSEFAVSIDCATGVFGLSAGYSHNTPSPPLS